MGEYLREVVATDLGIDVYMGEAIYFARKCLSWGQRSHGLHIHEAFQSGREKSQLSLIAEIFKDI